MRSYWVGVASREHVLAAVSGGFCQLNHGKEAPLKRMQPGDRLVYYSPREAMRGGESVQAFTAIGEILDRAARQGPEVKGFSPFRRDVQYFNAREAPIKPLLPHLSFAHGTASWGQVLRRGTFRIERGDYQLIAQAMQVFGESD
ncbi:MAG: EVE domain-containing protein [Acidobacteriales bacterium]|nr:EVE domain-containing protein [Terriglobales bacterium]